MRPGDAVAVRINAHRAGWNGTICQNPTAWDCGGQSDFRISHCERPSSCFHIHTFDEQEPRVEFDEQGSHWLLAEDIHALDDQILFFYNFPFSEPLGVREGASAARIVYGAYRVKSVISRQPQLPRGVDRPPARGRLDPARGARREVPAASLAFRRSLHPAGGSFGRRAHLRGREAGGEGKPEALSQVTMSASSTSTVISAPGSITPACALRRRTARRPSAP
ncbi:MAG: hypothetical protein R3F20_18980 [Planctomycetota bacterium]